MSSAQTDERLDEPVAVRAASVDRDGLGRRSEASRANERAQNGANKEGTSYVGQRARINEWAMDGARKKTRRLIDEFRRGYYFRLRQDSHLDPIRLALAQRLTRAHKADGCRERETALRGDSRTDKECLRPAKT
uniref:Uncharacterized protein n=1 Tax=Plectus sambesii TaxID=2011161 RepID=A0A914WXB4_9BILA